MELQSLTRTKHTWFWLRLCSMQFYMKSLKIPNGGIRIRKSEKDRQHNGQKKKDKRINNNLQNTKVRATWTSLKTGSELRCSGRVGSSCSTSGTRRITLVTNTVIRRECGTDQKVLTTSGTYALSFVTQIFRNGQPSHGGEC